MAQIVVNGADIACSFGTTPQKLIATPAGQMVASGSQPVARISDIKPTGNIPPFGACTTVSNPQVASATSAALGVLTPQPCVPVIPAPWSPGSTSVTVGGTPALTSDSKCACMWGGQISISSPGQTSVSNG